MGSVVMDGLMDLVVRVSGIGMLSSYILKPEFPSLQVPIPNFENFRIFSMGFENHANLSIAEVTTSTAAGSWAANSSSALVILPNKTWESSGLGLDWRIVGS